MDTPLAHLLRIFRLALAIVIGALLTLGLGLPRGRDSVKSRFEARQRVQRGSAWLLSVFRRLGLVHVEVRHPGRLESGQPTMVVANHPSFIDILPLLAHVDDACCVVNGALSRDVIFSGVVRRAGYIQNEGAGSVIREAASTLEAGRSVIVFPEGTRSPPGGLGEFRRGAAHIALATGCPIIPVSIFVDPPALTKNRRWWHIPRRTIQMTLEIGEPMSPSPRIRDEHRRAQAARLLTAELKETFLKTLARGRTPSAHI